MDCLLKTRRPTVGGTWDFVAKTDNASGKAVRASKSFSAGLNILRNVFFPPYMIKKLFSVIYLVTLLPVLLHHGIVFTQSYFTQQS